jgi:hypothetical protein
VKHLPKTHSSSKPTPLVTNSQEHAHQATVHQQTLLKH